MTSAADVEPDPYRVLFDAGPRASWVVEIGSLRFLAVNRAACEQYGWSEAEFLAMTVRDVKPEDEIPHFEVSYAEALRSVRPLSRVSRHRTKAGQIKAVDVEIARTTFRGRDVFLVSVTDVTGADEAERRFRLLVENCGEGITCADENLIVTYVSPGVERILGIPPEELIGASAGSRTHPDDVSVLAKLGPGETRVVVSRSQHRDGTWRWIEATTRNLTRDPAVRGWVSNFRDITERYEIEQAIRDTKRRLEFLLSATAAITYTATPSNGFGTTFMSANVADVLGHEARRFLIDREFWRNNIHPDDLASVLQSLQLLYEFGETSIQYRFRHADGSYRWIQDVCRIVGGEVVGYWIDVTERNRAETALRRSELNFRTLIERAPTATWVHRNRRFLYANPAAVALLGYAAADELVGRVVLDFVHPDDRGLVDTRMQRCADGTPAGGEARMLRRDGGLVIVDALGVLLDFDGAPANVVFGTDITERREMFARMALTDRMVSIGTLAAGVAHEINNPLAYVTSNLGLLASELPLLIQGRSRLDGRSLGSLLADAQEGAARVSAIVRDLRVLSRPEDDKPGPIDVIATLASAIKMAHNEIRHRARVVHTYGERLPPVHGNASRLNQVFLNLLLNAAHAIEGGRIEANEIRVRAYARCEQVHVEIEDTGAGIAPDVIGRIFDPFFTTKAPGIGMGLGLAICHQIVRALGGSISVASVVGHGSTFHVALPVARVAAADVSAEPAHPAPCSARVLMIDDEPAVGRSTRVLLSPEHDVTPVTRAKDALARLAAGEQFDVILCDLMMPEMGGIEFYEQLGKVAPQYLDRIVFMTGGAFTEHARNFLASVKSPHIEKPFSESELRRAIEARAAGQAITSPEDPA